GHVSPEAAVGGNIALVKDEDEIKIDLEKNSVDLMVSESELAQRRKEWKPRKPNYERGVLAKYASLVTSASEGAITKPLF
ncbi:MAG: dihydroxy-acid dehydratase, partial [Thaumarchaeota archaeon]